ncbi:MAG: tol-pal system protein YbgF [Alphaproteobacteria bacterium]|nr:tol-pal system protein YbgF [Alphaproteobacteria bacterium]
MKHCFKFFLFLGIFVFAVEAKADLNVDARALYDRMDRLERDITLMQRKLYKGGQNAGGSAQSMQEGSVQHLYAKIGDLEELVAQMTSQMEEYSHQLSVLQEEVKRINADVDFRLNEMKQTATATTPATPEPVAEKKEEKPKDAKSAYNEAFDLLKQLKYEEAEESLQSFLKNYPDDELAGNAQYWLGETYYVRGLYEPAAVAFATGFKNYKQNSKAADNLLKLGLSMQQLGKKQEACTAFKNLKKEFPKASDTLLSRAAKESDKLGCDK